jgi:hypothetical protein
MPEIAINQGVYSKVSLLVKEWLHIHKGETFDLDTICRQLAITERENRKYVAIELSKRVHSGELEKSNKSYHYIDNTSKYIDWVNASEGDTLDIAWPYGREDGSQFGFDGYTIVSPGDVIVVVGNSNVGKTTFAHNFLWENMDKYPCTLMGNEYSPAKFKRRVSRMDWADPLKEDGCPKFELIERHDSWKDIIRPDNINIIDWINLGDNFYQIGSIIEGIQSKLSQGIVMIVLQKAPGKELGLGGGFSMHLASLYLSIDFERLTILKCKEWHDHNPNNGIYGFTIVNGGTKFHNIRPIKKCPKCWGTGHAKGGGECDCNKGWVDA